jgi:hypothetical protein
MRAGWFVVLSLVAALVSGTVTLVAPMTIAAVHCNPTFSEGVFLAYCSHPKFTDYEHGAYYLGLEPEATARLESAQVLVLGSSLAQMSFSTDATSSYFKERRLSYYLLGFGYNEGGRFSTAVLSRVSDRPSLYIIHAFAFFGNHLSTAAEAAMGDDATVQYLSKKLGAESARWICNLLRSWCGPYNSIYRNRDTGSWDWVNTYSSASGTRPIPLHRPTAGVPSPDEFTRAESFAASLKVPPECIIVTMTPNAEIDLSENVRLIAEHIHARALIPQLDGLVTLDGWHLDKPSAERWSKAFLQQLDVAAGRCANFINGSSPPRPRGRQELKHY